jgi:hypothetical protein
MWEGGSKLKLQYFEPERIWIIDSKNPLFTKLDIYVFANTIELKSGQHLHIIPLRGEVLGA